MRTHFGLHGTAHQDEQGGNREGQGNYQSSRQRRRHTQGKAHAARKDKGPDVWRVGKRPGQVSNASEDFFWKLRVRPPHEASDHSANFPVSLDELRLYKRSEDPGRLCGRWSRELPNVCLPRGLSLIKQ